MRKCEIASLGTHLKVADIAKSREFYESLGFEPAVCFGDAQFRSSFPPGVRSVEDPTRGVIFHIGQSAELEIADAHIAVPNRDVYEERIVSPKVSAMVKVRSLVPLFSNPLVRIVFPVRRYYWGTLEAAFRDPDGYVLVFISAYTEEEMRLVSAHTNVETISLG